MISSIKCEVARRAPRVAGLAWLAWLGHAALAHAGPAADDPAAAEALFKEARALVEAGDFAAGCPKFAASLALHASASTALNIARCHERDGKLASAYAAYQQALTFNHETKGAQRRKGLESLAREGIAALEPRLPRLRVIAEDAPDGLEVTRDGEALPASAWNEPQPIDPGRHELRATAPGRVAQTYALDLAEGETETVTVALALAPTQPPPSEPPERRRGRVPAWAWATGAVGLGLAGASIYFLVDDLAAIDALRSHCRDFDGGTYCDPGYDFAADNARKNRDLGLFVGLGSAGLIAITAAVVGIARSGKRKPPRKTAASPWLVPGGAGLHLVGRF